MIYFYSMIFVTGGTGIVGAHLLLNLLKKGKKIRALKRKTANTEEVKKIFSYYENNANELFSKIEWAEGDLLDVLSLNSAMQNIEEVYHCAAMVSMNPSDRQTVLHNNVTGTANVVNVSLEKKVRRFCHVSSVAALGTNSNGSLISEDNDWNNNADFSSYSLSKYLSEKEVWRGCEEGLSAVIVNPAIIIGPGNWKKSSASIFYAAMKGIKWYSQGGMAYVDARDVAETMVQLMHSEIKNERFIIASENMAYKQFMELINTSVGKPLPQKKAGKLILELVWRADKIKSILTNSPHLITKEIARYARITLCYSNEKIKKALGFNFIPVSQSIRDAAKCFLADNTPAKQPKTS